MKVVLHKKSLFFSVLFVILTLKTSAQMLDLMGNMAVGGVQNIHSIRSVGQLNHRLNVVQFINQLNMKNAEITTTYFGNYKNMPVQSMAYKDIKVIFRPVNAGRNYEAFISPLSFEICKKILNSNFDNLSYFRFVSNGISSDYTVQQARSNTGLCVTSYALVLVLE